MNVSKLASAVYNNVVSGLSGYNATLNELSGTKLAVIDDATANQFLAETDLMISKLDSIIRVYEQTSKEIIDEVIITCTMGFKMPLFGTRSVNCSHYEIPNIARMRPIS